MHVGQSRDMDVSQEGNPQIDQTPWKSEPERKACMACGLSQLFVSQMTGT